MDQPDRQRKTTLHLLGLFLIFSLVGNEEYLFITAGQFKIAPFDILFWLLLFYSATFFLSHKSLSEATAPRIAPHTLIGSALVWAFLSLLLSQNTLADRLRDFRLIVYFLVPPLLCCRLIVLSQDEKLIHGYIIAGGLMASLAVMSTAITDSGLGYVARNIRVGVYAIPAALCSIALFRERLKLGSVVVVVATSFLLAGLLVSQNRSQYFQFLLSILLLGLMVGRNKSFGRYIGLLAICLLAITLSLAGSEVTSIIRDRLLSVQDLDSDNSFNARLQESDSQIEEFFKNPIWGSGIGYRILAMSDNGFELSTFAHNSWLFYLVKFGIIGLPIMLSGIVLFPFWLIFNRPLNQLQILHRAYLLAVFPVYFYIDMLSAGLAYAPKTPVSGFFLTYGLAVIYDTYSSSESTQDVMQNQI